MPRWGVWGAAAPTPPDPTHPAPAPSRSQGDVNLSGQSSLLRPCSSGLSQCQPRPAGGALRQSLLPDLPSSVPPPPEAPQPLCARQTPPFPPGRTGCMGKVDGRQSSGEGRSGWDRPPSCRTRMRRCPVSDGGDWTPVPTLCPHSSAVCAHAPRVTPVPPNPPRAPPSGGAPSPQPVPAAAPGQAHTVPGSSPGSRGPRGPQWGRAWESVTLNRERWSICSQHRLPKADIPSTPQAAAKQQAATPALYRRQQPQPFSSLTTALYAYRQLSISRATNLPVRKPGLLAKLGTSLHVFIYSIQRKGRG